MEIIKDNSEGVDSCEVNNEKPDVCINENLEQKSSTENILSKRQLKKLKKRDKWLKSKPEKR